MTADLRIDLVTAAVQRLRAYAPFQQLLAEGLIGTDADDTASAEVRLAKAWLFQGLDNEGRPFRDPEGSGTSVIVLSERGEWATANAHNSAYFPSLQMLVYTDCSRDADGGVVMRDGDRKAKHIFRILDRCFHLPGNAPVDRAWPGLMVHASVRGNPFTLTDVPGTETYTVRGEARYDVTTD
jgi:hypothetical protein